MAGWNGSLRYLAARAALAAATALAAVLSADAQWFSPLGAAPPSEITQRLEAEGYVLIRPLQRNDTVYFADVTAGAGGRQRLVIDAWSGEILQRFVARRGSAKRGFAGGYVVEGGEFSSPPPLGPPPARDFGARNFVYGEPGGPSEPAPRSKLKPKSTATARRPAEPNPATAAAPPAQPVNPPGIGGNGNPANPGNPGASAAAAPTGAPAPSTQPAKQDEQQPSASTKTEASPPGASPTTPSQPAQVVAPKPEAAPASPPAAAQTQAKDATRSSGPTPPAPAAKPGEKSKVNDLPVNPLE